MELDELTLGQINIIKSMFNEPKCKHPYVIGKNYLIRTVTMIYTGRLVEVHAQELVLEKACWIPETDRWNESVKNCTFSEQEPYPEDRQVIIGRGAVLDCVQISELVSEVK